jgi:hypothetical protein
MSRGWNRFFGILSLCLSAMFLFDFISLIFFGNPHQVPFWTVAKWGVFGLIFLVVGISQVRNWR